MAQPSEKKLNELLALVNELKTDLNALRVDLEHHDHGATYTQVSLRYTAVGSTGGGISGSPTGTTADAVAPSDFFKA